TAIYALSLHDALPISPPRGPPGTAGGSRAAPATRPAARRRGGGPRAGGARSARRAGSWVAPAPRLADQLPVGVVHERGARVAPRSEEHTSELQSRENL